MYVSSHNKDGVFFCKAAMTQGVGLHLSERCGKGNYYVTLKQRQYRLLEQVYLVRHDANYFAALFF